MTREELHDLNYLIRKYEHAANTCAKNAQQEGKYGDPKKAVQLLDQRDHFQMVAKDLEQFARMHRLQPEAVPVLVVPSGDEIVAGITT